MTDVTETTPAPPSADPSAAPDLATAAQRVLAASDEPLTVSKLRAKLPAALRGTDLKELSEALDRLAASKVLHKYPKYRSQQDRYWDRGMTTHIAVLMRTALEESPLAWSELRRKLPAYAHPQAEAVRDEQMGQGLLHRHPRAGSRGAERIGVRPPDPKDYLRQELPDLFRRLAGLGFTRPQIRAAALELLHEEEWDTEPPAPPEPEASAEPPASEPQGQLAGPHTSAALHGETHSGAPGAAHAPDDKAHHHH
jgi:hypothetical protein